MEHEGQNSDYRIDYVIGSGAHASCFLARVGDHLFESPLCYYPGRGYAMAPGFEDNPAPGYTRPITMECLLCHSDKPLDIPGSLNRYRSPAFDGEAISCDRCHGDSARHLKRPVPGSIVNPAKLPIAERDSVCERCHLAGAIRILNPGKSLADYHPGQTLETAFTTYVASAGPGSQAPLKVISQSEELAQSQCAIGSKGRLWCGTCHDPHNQRQDAAAYRAICLNCHREEPAAGHPPKTSDCVSCHMPRREAQDGGHAAFTDHRIARRPGKESPEAPIENLRAWREPPLDLRERNRALALNYAGARYSSPSLVDESYPLLLAAQKKAPNDPDVLAAIARALLTRGQPADAAKTYDRALSIHRDDFSLEDGAGRAYLAEGDQATAALHFERALQLDPLLIPDIEALLQIYGELGDQARSAELMQRVHDAMKTPPASAGR